jgi:hypothetical protein
LAAFFVAFFAVFFVAFLVAFFLAGMVNSPELEGEHPIAIPRWIGG